MEEKLKRAALRLQEVEMLLSQPEVYADPARLRDLNREQKELAPVVTAFRELEAARDMQREAEGMGVRELPASRWVIIRCTRRQSNRAGIIFISWMRPRKRPMLASVPWARATRGEP